MTENLITLSSTNCKAKAITHRNNVLVEIEVNMELSPQVAVMHKKYFNQIAAHAMVTGRLRYLEDGLLIFEGFSFK